MVAILEWMTKNIRKSFVFQNSKMLNTGEIKRQVATKARIASLNYLHYVEQQLIYSSENLQHNLSIQFNPSLSLFLITLYLHKKIYYLPTTPKQ